MKAETNWLSKMSKSNHSQKITTYNQLESKSIELVIDRLPNVNYFCTSAALPGVSSNAWRQPSPFTDVKVPGDKIQFQPLIVNFIVDEHLNNWKEIKDWIYGYAHPNNFEEYQESGIDANKIFQSKKSDAILLIPNNKYNVKHKFKFIDVFPIDLTDIIIDIQIDQTPNIICTTTFEYTTYDIIS